MNDFDFLIGSWQVANRQLATLFAGSNEWLEYPSTSVCQSLFGGAGNLDEITSPTKGTRGMTLRLFDQRTGQWSLYWANSRDGVLLPPVVGGFADARGDFYGDDLHEGRPIRVHYIWSRITPHSARWEQEFSADGGQSWETNWFMDFTRA